MRCTFALSVERGTDRRAARRAPPRRRTRERCGASCARLLAGTQAIPAGDHRAHLVHDPLGRDLERVHARRIRSAAIMPAKCQSRANCRPPKSDVSGLAIASMPGESARPVSTTSGASTKPIVVYAAFLQRVVRAVRRRLFAQLQIVRLHRPQLRNVARPQHHLAQAALDGGRDEPRAASTRRATHAKKRCQRRPSARS